MYRPHWSGWHCGCEVGVWCGLECVMHVGCLLVASSWFFSSLFYKMHGHTHIKSTATCFGPKNHRQTEYKAVYNTMP
jgi:hypothetical protein